MQNGSDAGVYAQFFDGCASARAQGQNSSLQTSDRGTSARRQEAQLSCAPYRVAVSPYAPLITNRELCAASAPIHNCCSHKAIQAQESAAAGASHGCSKSTDGCSKSTDDEAPATTTENQ